MIVKSNDEKFFIKSNDENLIHSPNIWIFFFCDIPDSFNKEMVKCDVKSTDSRLITWIWIHIEALSSCVTLGKLLILSECASVSSSKTSG